VAVSDQVDRVVRFKKFFREVDMKKLNGVFIIGHLRKLSEDGDLSKDLVAESCVVEDVLNTFDNNLGTGDSINCPIN
jgi:hypothetical protein